MSKKPASKPGRELLFSVTLNDCDIQTFAHGGPGGQHANHSNTAVRIIHRASGARGESREFRSQHQNKIAAFRKMAESGKFRAWVNRQVWFAGESPEKRVEHDTAPDNLKVEVRENGYWITEDENEPGRVHARGARSTRRK